jgi:sugar phosphate isomerase/epimerase
MRAIDMTDRPDRRRFLGRAALAGAGLAGTGLASRRCQAIEPVTHGGGYKFKFSLAAYSYRNLLNGDPPKLTLSDFIDDCAKMGLEGTELTSYYFPKDVTDQYLRRVKAESFLRGLDVSGTAVGNDFCDPPGPQRDAQIASVKRWIEHADTMDAPVIRIFSGRIKQGQKRADAHRLAVAAIEECCDFAGQHGLFLALENHGGLTTEVDGILALVRDVKSPWFGVNVDTGNFHTADVYADLARLAPYAVNVQVKVAISPAGQGQQPADFKRLATIFRNAGYRGYIVLEYEEKDDPRTACPRYVDQIRAAFV